jgi:hypothetical protein
MLFIGSPVRCRSAIFLCVSGIGMPRKRSQTLPKGLLPQ